MKVFATLKCLKFEEYRIQIHEKTRLDWLLSIKAWIVKHYVLKLFSFNVSALHVSMNSFHFSFSNNRKYFFIQTHENTWKYSSFSFGFNDCKQIYWNAHQFARHSIDTSNWFENALKLERIFIVANWNGKWTNFCFVNCFYFLFFIFIFILHNLWNSFGVPCVLNSNVFFFTFKLFSVSFLLFYAVLCIIWCLRFGTL